MPQTSAERCAKILEMTDPKALLAGSGWYPGIPLH